MSVVVADNDTVRRIMRDVSLPTDENTAIAIIAMANSAKSFLSHRCVRSIRASGEFTGHILVFTDEAGYALLAPTLNQDRGMSSSSNSSRTIVIQGRHEDLHPTWPHNGTAIKYRIPTVIYKRFKTLLDDYVSRDPNLDGVIEHILYLDVDNVMAGPVRLLFQDYYRELPKQLAIAAAAAAADEGDGGDNNFGFFSHWRDPARPNVRWQSGQTMHHRRHSGPCNAMWRYQMDHSPGMESDQYMLNTALKLQQQQREEGGGAGLSRLPDHQHYDMSRQCAVLRLPNPDRHLAYATNELLSTITGGTSRNRTATSAPDHASTTTTSAAAKTDVDPDDDGLTNSRTIPTIVHITGLRLLQVDAALQRAFLRTCLKLREEEVAVVSVTNTTTADMKGGGAAGPNRTTTTITTTTTTTIFSALVAVMEDGSSSSSPFMADGVPWDEVAQAVGTKGMRPKDGRNDDTAGGDDRGKKRRSEKIRRMKARREWVKNLGRGAA